MQEIGNKGIGDILRMITVYKSAALSLRSQQLSVYNLMPEHQLGIQKRDRRCHDPIPEEVRKVLPRRIVIVYITAIDHTRCDLRT
jgi:hypothetical protein